jgi:Fe-S cluster biogenesis protein NfuA
MRRANLPPEVQRIEEILDETVRPGLQGDGGDLDVVKYEDNKLYVFYQGACGTCPSATSGTLMAIEGILRDQFNPTIEVIPM